MGNLIIYITLIFLGVFGLLGATFLFPIVVTLVSKLKINKCNTQKKDINISRINILIPAHNEEETITNTIESIQLAISKSYEIFPNIKYSIMVFADDCKDKTEEKALSTGVDVYSGEQHLGKWNVIEYLVKKSENSDWVILVDAGSVWDINTLTNLIPYMKSEEYIAIMPSYRRKEANLLERLSWSIERIIKNLENFCGGPITAHGATVAYNTKVISSALYRLQGRAWLNDDVVIPLIIRIQNNIKKSIYLPKIVINDESKKTTLKREFKRRLRLIRGNLEWISLINIKEATIPIILLSGRRVFRILWGYWLLLIALGILLFSVKINETLTIISLISFACLFILTFKCWRGIFEAFIASIFSPFLLLQKNKGDW